MKNDPNKTTASSPPLPDAGAPSLDDNWAFSPLPGQTLTLALSVEFEATKSDPYGRERSDEIRSILTASGYIVRDIRLAVPIKSIPTAAELERRRRLHARAAELARRSAESREAVARVMARRSVDSGRTG